MSIDVQYTDTLANLWDLNYEGVYSGTVWHEADLFDVVKRSWKNGMDKIIIAGSSLKISRRSLILARTNDNLYCTAGCQPSGLEAFQDQQGPEKYEDKLLNLCLAHPNKVVAVGKCELNYRRDDLELCPKETQYIYLKMQFEVAQVAGLPVILTRTGSAAEDLIAILKEYEGRFEGVIHSFDGSLKEAETYLNMGFYIGLTGCSLRKKKSMEMIKNLPLNRVIFGTDCPRCNVTPSRPGGEFVKTKFPAIKKMYFRNGDMVKGRNEPVNIIQLFEAIGGIRNIKPELLALLNQVNSNKLFFHEEDTEKLPP